MDTGTVTFLSILGAVVLLIADYFIATQFSEIAEMKGYYDRKYFWYTFLFGIAGMLMVIALPMKNKEPAGPKNRQKYRCDKCGYEGYYDADCPKCGSSLKRIVYDQTE